MIYPRMETCIFKNNLGVLKNKSPKISIFLMEEKKTYIGESHSFYLEDNIYIKKCCWI